MTYPLVHAAFDYGPRTGPVLAFVVHMAEGGGTVGYLSRSPARGVSVHYVIEYTGRIVQMLEEGHASGSINPNDLRTSDDATGPYGFSAAVDVMGSWAQNPNAACLSVEVEGFAAAGPNDKQIVALQSLIADIRRRHPTIGLLGHRDFQDYKACPGRLIPWELLGGHGEGETMAQAPITDTTPKLVDLPKGAPLYDLDGRTVVAHAGAAQVSDPSPYAVGSKRAVYATIGTRRTVLVAPTAVRPVPPPVVTCDDVVTRELEAAAARAAAAVRTRP